jgi:type III pantothenate kinase
LSAHHSSPITPFDERMPVLAIDAGNTRIKWGVHDGEGWLMQDWIATARAGSIGSRWAKLARPETAIACNVAGEVVRRSLAAAARRFALPLEFITSRKRQCGVVSSYDRPAQLGSDRWAALIGARHLFHGACVVVNVGTTMTVDALTGEGVFLGGMIVPGPDLMPASLARNTARLRPRAGNYAFFPGGTEDAIASGTINALAGAVERMQRFMREAGLATPLVIVSGGAAGTVASALNDPVEVVDNLVLEGLLRIALKEKA